MRDALSPSTTAEKTTDVTVDSLVTGMQRRKKAHTQHGHTGAAKKTHACGREEEKKGRGEERKKGWGKKGLEGRV